MYDDLDAARFEFPGASDSRTSHWDLPVLLDVLIRFLLNYLATFPHNGSCKTSAMLNIGYKKFITYLEVLIRSIGNCFYLLRGDISHVNAHLKPALQLDVVLP